MKANHNWKIKIAFIVTPILSLGMFTLTYYAIWNSNNETPFGVYVFLGLFGLLGIWTASVTLMKGKNITINENKLIIRRFLKLGKNSISSNEIEDVQNFTKSENPFMNYELLVFRTIYQKEFWIVSYEFNNYLKIKKWLFTHSKGRNKKIYLTNNFLSSQYLKPLLFSIVVFTLIVIPLCVKTFYNNV